MGHGAWLNLLVELPSDWFCWGPLSPVESTHGGASSLCLLGRAQPFGCICSGSLVVARRLCFPFRSSTSLRALLLMMTHRHMLFVSRQRIDSCSLSWHTLVAPVLWWQHFENFAGLLAAACCCILLHPMPRLQRLQVTVFLFICTC